MKSEANVDDVGLVRQAPWRRRELTMVMGKTQECGCPYLHVGPLWTLYLNRIQTPSSLESLNIRAVVDLEE